MTVKNGLYSIRIAMKDGGRGHATGVIVLLDGQILGGDSHFYYTGSYTFKNGKWRGEVTTCEHTKAVGLNMLFGGREVSCGFTGKYTDGEAEVSGTALVGKTSILFEAVLNLSHHYSSAGMTKRPVVGDDETTDRGRDIQPVQQ